MFSALTIRLLGAFVAQSNYSAACARAKVEVGSIRRSQSQEGLELQIQRGFDLKEQVKTDPTNIALLEQYVELLGKIDYASEGEREILKGPDEHGDKRSSIGKRNSMGKRGRISKRTSMGTKNNMGPRRAQRETDEAATANNRNVKAVATANFGAENFTGGLKDRPSAAPWNDRRLSRSKYASIDVSVRKPDEHRSFDVSVNIKHAILAGLAEAGSSFLVREAQPYKKSIGKVFARYFTFTHDYAIEEGSTEKPKYMLSGKAWTQHQRFHLVVPGEDTPRFTVRRAYGYYNPIGNLFGQIVYRIIPYKAENQTGFAAFSDYHPKDAVLTITRDRFGRGAFWARQEWRVYEGHGGCWHYGMLTCDSKKQLYYAMSKGWSDTLKYDMEIFRGPIFALAGNAKSGSLYGGKNLNTRELEERKVAVTKHEVGIGRRLNWAIASLLSSVSLWTQLPLNPVWTLPQLLWVDKYKVIFKHPTDELLMTVLVALQDASNDFAKAKVSLR